MSVADRITTPAELARATAELDALPLPFAFALGPARLPIDVYRSMSAGWAAFRQGVEAFVERHDGDLARMAADLRLPPHFVPVWGALPQRDWALIARPDMVVSGAAPFIVDVNAGSTAGLLPLNDMILRAHQVPPVSHLFDIAAEPRFLMGRYTDVMRRFLTDEGDLISVTDFAEDGADKASFHSWHYRSEVHELARSGLTARIVNLEDLDITTRGVFAPDGRRVGLVHRYFLPDPNDAHHMTQVRRIARAVHDGVVRLFTGLWGEIVSTKAMLAVLSDERFTADLAPSLADRLRRVIPWTRSLEERHTVWRGNRIDLVEWVIRNSARLVLKPSLGNGGRAVLIGREAAQADWANAVHGAIDGDESWVVQELLVPDDTTVRFYDPAGEVRIERTPAVYGAFVLDGQFAGAMCRHGIHGDGNLMINGIVGAIPAPVYWEP